MPEPVPPVLPLVALMVTTLGEAFTAAAVMALTSSLLLTITVPGWPVLPVEASGRFPSRALLPATTPPPTRPAARMLATRVGTPKAALRFGALPGWPNEFWGAGPVGGWLPYPPSAPGVWAYGAVLGAPGWACPGWPGSEWGA